MSSKIEASCLLPARSTTQACRVLTHATCSAPGTHPLSKLVLTFLHVVTCLRMSAPSHRFLADWIQELLLILQAGSIVIDLVGRCVAVVDDRRVDGLGFVATSFVWSRSVFVVVIFCDLVRGEVLVNAVFCSLVSVDTHVVVCAHGDVCSLVDHCAVSKVLLGRL